MYNSTDIGFQVILVLWYLCGKSYSTDVHILLYSTTEKQNFTKQKHSC